MITAETPALPPRRHRPVGKPLAARPRRTSTRLETPTMDITTDDTTSADRALINIILAALGPISDGIAAKDAKIADLDKQVAELEQQLAEAGVARATDERDDAAALAPVKAAVDAIATALAASPATDSGVPGPIAVEDVPTAVDTVAVPGPDPTTNTAAAAAAIPLPDDVDEDQAPTADAEPAAAEVPDVDPPATAEAPSDLPPAADDWPAVDTSTAAPIAPESASVPEPSTGTADTPAVAYPDAVASPDAGASSAEARGAHERDDETTTS